MHNTDDDDTDTDDDPHPPSEKRKGLTALPKESNQAPKFKYPPGWKPRPIYKCAGSNRAEAVSNQGGCGV